LELVEAVPEELVLELLNVVGAPTSIVVSVPLIVVSTKAAVGVAVEVEPVVRAAQDALVASNAIDARKEWNETIVSGY
jgi:ribosomal protein L7Ae-like RNA K-turn-binding protein